MFQSRSLVILMLILLVYLVRLLSCLMEGEIISPVLSFCKVTMLSQLCLGLSFHFRGSPKRNKFFEKKIIITAAFYLKCYHSTNGAFLETQFFISPFNERKKTLKYIPVPKIIVSLQKRVLGEIGGRMKGIFC